MKIKKLRILFAAVACLLLASCGGGMEPLKQVRDIFPLPCKSKIGGSHDCNHYYVDNKGEKVEGIQTALESIRDKHSYLNYSLDFYKDGFTRIEGELYNLDGNKVCGEKEGKEKYGFKYDAKYHDFSEGIGWAYCGSYNSIAIDKNGDELFQLDADVVSPFYNGYAIVRDRNYIHSVIDKEGNTVLELDENEDSQFPYVVDGKLVVSLLNVGMGVIDLNGEMLIDFQREYTICSAIDQNSNLLIMKDGLYGLMDLNGNVTIEPEYVKLQCDGSWYYFENEDKEIGWCDMNGEIMIPARNYNELVKELNDEWYASGIYPFYGSKYAVLNVIDKRDSHGKRDYFKVYAWTVEELQSEDFEIDEAKHTLDNCELLSPFVNGKAIFWSHITNNEGIVTEDEMENESETVADDDRNRFVPYLTPSYAFVKETGFPEKLYNRIGKFVVYPWAEWR